MIVKEEDYLAHFGILRKSGRYPWGSGSDVVSRSTNFLGAVAELKKQGLSEANIAKGLGLESTTELRAATTIANNAKKQADISTAIKYKEKAMSNVAIGKRMGINESSVRALLAAHNKDQEDILQTVSSFLRNQVKEKGIIDVGTGIEHHLNGISETKLKVCLAILKEEGYEVHKVQVDQQGTNNKTVIRVLAPPGTTYKDIVADKSQIKSIIAYSDTNGRSILNTLPPLVVSSKRLEVKYKEDGGAEADGVIYVRPGVKDLSMGKARYAQVRIAVDGTHYLKGMAIPKPDLPDGVDLQFNTNKSNTGNKLDALKKVGVDEDNPFGAVFRQIGDRDKDGQITKVTSALNIVNEEGNWETWKNSISTQVLSKQSPILAKTQLDMTYEQKKAELDSILALTNPAVKKTLLESYASDADASAVHLKAKGLAGQASHVILPINSMKPTEVYAPNYKDGERVALVRYPHGGKFEIPELIVNNNQKDAKALLGNARDAIGINHKVAERLSGADFDGDTVLVIPNSTGRLKSEPALEGLKGFDAQARYKLPDDAPRMSARTKGIEMGDVSNLITDMTIRGAPNADLARAVRHSMVVIDAEKHHLDYKQSAIDNGIAQLKEKYQGRNENGQLAGASTLISRATSQTRVPEQRLRKAAEGGPIDPKTGKLVFVKTGESYVDKKGKVVEKKTKLKQLEAVDDARLLSSGTPIEKLYADHSNRLKNLANVARKEQVAVKPTPYSKSAKEAYSEEVKSLNAKLVIALRNSPLERQAQVLANTTVALKRQADPHMDDATLKKVKGQALLAARARTGAKKVPVDITPREWEAIQAGAISNHKLESILKNSDLDKVKALATPRTKKTVTSAMQSRAQAMFNNGYTQAEVAEALGIPLGTLKDSIYNGE